MEEATIPRGVEQTGSIGYRAVMPAAWFHVDSIPPADSATLLDAKEADNIDDESRKKFEISARSVFRKYKACLALKGLQDHRSDSEEISVHYKTLRDDRDKADTSAIIRKLNAIVSDAIEVKADLNSDDKVFEISKTAFACCVRLERFA